MALRTALLAVLLQRCDSLPPTCSPSDTSGACSTARKPGSDADPQSEDMLIQFKKNVKSRLQADCCSNCGGKQAFCSPGSGQCYDSKHKHYYQSCSTGDSEDVCCVKCGGAQPFCSPDSGSCYDSKNKDYYASCTTTTTTPRVGEHECCDTCAGAKAFCSPGSGNCYSTMKRDYYESCTTTTTTPCAGINCPIGWNPDQTLQTRGTGQWCEVGMPADDWTALNTHGSSSATATVKVLTYNLFWWHLFELKRGEDGRAGKKIAATNTPEAYDFMGFQECKDVARVLRDARSHGLPDDYEVLSYVDGDIALGMMYNKKRWTKLSSGTEHVGVDSPKQFYGRRGVQWARFESNDGAKVFFINHHGPLPVSEGGGCTGTATAMNILRVIAQNAHSDDGLVLVGDFNAHESSSRIQALSKYMNKVYSGISMGGVDHIFTNCGEEDVLRKDNLGSGGSDHHALSVVLRIPVYTEGVVSPTPAPTPKTSPTLGVAAFGRGIAQSTSLKAGRTLEVTHSRGGLFTWACEIPNFGVAACNEEESVLTLWKNDSTFTDVSLAPLVHPVGAVYLEGKVFVACFGGGGLAGLAIVDPFTGTLVATHAYSDPEKFVHNVYAFDWAGTDGSEATKEIFVAVLGNPWNDPPIKGDGLVRFDRMDSRYHQTGSQLNARSAVQESEDVFYVLTQQPHGAPTRLARLERDETGQLMSTATTELPARGGGDGGADVMLAGNDYGKVFCTDRTNGVGKLYYFSYSPGSFDLLHTRDTGKHPRHTTVLENGDVVACNKHDATLTIFHGLSENPTSSSIEVTIVPTAKDVSFFMESKQLK